VNLFTENEKWRAYWQHVTDPADVERQLARLRWLDEYSFHCEGAIPADYFRALQQQIESGEKKLAELRGDDLKTLPPASCINPLRRNPRAPDSGQLRGNGFRARESSVSGARIP
jgi:hypothetical protein